MKRAAAVRVWTITLAAAGALAACASAPSERVAEADRSRPVGGEAIVAVRGAPLVIPAPGAAPGPVEATLDGRRVPATAHRIVVDAAPGSERSWTGVQARWREASAAEPGAVVARVSLPLDAVSGVLRLAGSAVGVRVVDAAPAPDPAVKAPRRDLAGEPGAGEAWRLDLSGVGLGFLADRHPAERAASLWLSARWRAGLARLASVDAWLERRVRATLTRTAEASGAQAPAWPMDADAETRLLEDLLDPSLTGGRVVERARAWLDGRAELTARVRDPASAGAIAVQATDLGGRAARTDVSDGRETGAAGLLRARESALVPAPAGEATRDRPFLIVSAGERSVTIPRPVERLVATPPGARIGPLALDLTMREWLEREAVALPVELATAALIHRRAHEAAWEVYIECKAPAGLAADRVTLWLGPQGREAAIATVDAQGRLENRGEAGVELVRHERLDDRWSALMSIPAVAIRPDGTVLVGLTREMERAAGERLRAAWPVALLPWEEAPGRAAVDLTEWLGL